VSPLREIGVLFSGTSMFLPMHGFQGTHAGGKPPDFSHRLRELGYIDGQNIAIRFLSAESQADRLPTLANDRLTMASGSSSRSGIRPSKPLDVRRGQSQSSWRRAAILFALDSSLMLPAPVGTLQGWRLSPLTATGSDFTPSRKSPRRCPEWPSYRTPVIHPTLSRWRTSAPPPLGWEKRRSTWWRRSDPQISRAWSQS
jgi:hypothetical protein